MVSKKYLFLKSVVLLMVLLSVPAGYEIHAQDFGGPPIVMLKVDAGTERMIYKVDQEVSIMVFLRNMSETALEIVEPAIDKRSLFFEITLPDGKKTNFWIFTV
jgi:hypothetical protein